MEKVSKILDYQNMDAKARALYDANNKEMAITYGVLETAKEEGRDEGRAEGIKEGIKEGMKEGIKEGIKEGMKEGRRETKIQVVCNAFRQGIPVPTIALVADSTEQEVKQILTEAGLIK